MKKAVFIFTYFSLILGLFGSSNAFAQSLSFDKTAHDFGTIKEEDGPQTIRFTFTNTGKEPITVKDVQASCGCTTPDWTKTPVKPGEKGYVDAQYDPRGRPGVFEKSLTISTDGAQPQTMVLNIKGEVKQKEPTIEDKYPTVKEGIRMATNYLNMGIQAPDGKDRTQEFELYNQTGKPVTFKQPTTNAAHFSIKISPEKVEDKGIAKVIITYNAKKKGDWGTIYDPFDIYTSEGKRLDMNVVSTIQMEGESLSDAEYAKRARLEFESVDHDFGEIEEGKIVTINFKFKNTGAKPLTIFKTKATCGCTASEPDKKELAPGESSNIKVTFNSTGKPEGMQTQSVTIYTNDPVKPTQRLMIKGKVKKKAGN